MRGSNDSVLLSELGTFYIFCWTGGCNGVMA